MSDKDINHMDFKELRNEVQLLRDELAIMRREYEDLFHNLDTENFSSELTKKINSVVTSDDVESRITQEADKISSEVEQKILSSEGGIYSYISFIEQTANRITIVVSDESEGTKSLFKQTSDGFRLDGNQVIISNMRNSSNESGSYGDSYVKVLSTGLNLFIYDTQREEYLEKIGLGFYSGYYDHPYITFGAGTGEETDDNKYTGKQLGCIYKLGNGLWIGDASACNVGGNYPCGTETVSDVFPTYLDGNGVQQDGRNITGIFIDFVNGAIYKYEKGIHTKL